MNTENNMASAPVHRVVRPLFINEKSNDILLEKRSNLLNECRNMRKPSPGNWPGEHVLPYWMIHRIDEALKSIKEATCLPNPSDQRAGASSAPSRQVAIAQWNRRHFDEVAATIVHDDEKKP